MTVKLQKWGNSQGIRIPKHMLDDLAWSETETVDISIDDGKIICHEDTDRLLSDYAIVKVAELSDVDLQYILRRRRESFGWSLLTDQKRFYAENYPGLVIERVTLDEFIMMMLKGETL